MLAESIERKSLSQAGAMPEFAIWRIAAAGGATRSELVRDLGPFFGHLLSPSEFREALQATIAGCEAAGAVQGARGRFQLTQTGQQLAEAAFREDVLGLQWSDIRDRRITARVLGLLDEPTPRIRGLARPDGLRMAILERAYDLRLKQTPTLARVRVALAGVTLMRAFGHQLGAGFRIDGGIDARSSRVLAGQLSRRPKDFGSDRRLIAELAAEAVGAAQNDISTLRLVLYRKYVTHRAQGGRAPLPLTPPEDRVGRAVTGPPAPRPDLDTFASAVLASAQRYAEGWAGNRKALICHVFDGVEQDHPDWALTEVEFKGMLIEAHRAGRVVLASADLKSKSALREFQRSAVTFKNTVWHFVRVPT